MAPLQVKFRGWRPSSSSRGSMAALSPHSGLPREHLFSIVSLANTGTRFLPKPENALAKSNGDGCICPPVDYRGTRRWSNIIVWLEDTPPMLEVGLQALCTSSVLAQVTARGQCCRVCMGRDSVCLAVRCLCDYDSNVKPYPQRRVSSTVWRQADRKVE
ncbi:hypothetical protein EDC04DRAFT_2734039 [Pisolithus marmoratus]|nr:hypothetical protein EDC04DRAFT_2734039 [Pisolithus marmoratus]